MNAFELEASARRMKTAQMMAHARIMKYLVSSALMR
jgi:hypothetical protein